MSLENPEGGLEFYDRFLRVVDSEGNIVSPKIHSDRYQEFIGEAVEPRSYMKFPYYDPRGYPDEIYRVGPIERHNVVVYCGTPHVDKELKE